MNPGADGEPELGRLLERAIRLAVDRHAGQADKAGAPYILHPLRVMARMATPREMMVAVLHDVVEDTPVTLDDLRREGLPDDVVAAVDALTRRGGESYDDFVARAGADRLARRVKIADLEDNMDLTRLGERGVSAADTERLSRYVRAWRRLTGGEAD